VKLTPTQAATTDVWALKHEPLPVNGNLLKLSDAGTVVRRKVTPEIHKEDQQYKRVVSFEYMGSASFGEKFLTKTLFGTRWVSAPSAGC
jgi:hypothetical protein